ncbi:adenosylhomocysteinase-like [Prosopis cineraria]|uniref:adenosylhomocysteinase-like n=1 Tax=Prosopis cineraria TaxID=364024 RepID=UPI00240F6E72|nr:adenosylhomocysteinase-like [Prosopis cineraria]
MTSGENYLPPLSMADFGRFAIQLAEKEMPQSMAYHDKLKLPSLLRPTQPSVPMFCCASPRQTILLRLPIIARGSAAVFPWPLAWGNSGAPHLILLPGEIHWNNTVGVSKEMVADAKKLYEYIYMAFSKSKVTCTYGFPDLLMRATNGTISEKFVVAFGFGDGQSSTDALLMQLGPHVRVATAALTNEDVLPEGDIFVNTVGDKYTIIKVNHMKKMKNDAIICSLGDFDGTGIDMRELTTYPDVKHKTMETGIDKWVFPESNTGIIILAEGLPMKMGLSYADHGAGSTNEPGSGLDDDEVVASPSVANLEVDHGHESANDVRPEFISLSINGGDRNTNLITLGADHGAG